MGMMALVETGGLDHQGTEPLAKTAACVGENVGSRPASQARALPVDPGVLVPCPGGSSRAWNLRAVGEWGALTSQES